MLDGNVKQHEAAKTPEIRTASDTKWSLDVRQGSTCNVHSMQFLLWHIDIIDLVITCLIGIILQVDASFWSLGRTRG